MNRLCIVLGRDCAIRRNSAECSVFLLEIHSRESGRAWTHKSRRHDRTALVIQPWIRSQRYHLPQHLRRVHKGGKDVRRTGEGEKRMTHWLRDVLYKEWCHHIRHSRSIGQHEGVKLKRQRRIGRGSSATLLVITCSCFWCRVVMDTAIFRLCSLGGINGRKRKVHFATT